MHNQYKTASALELAAWEDAQKQSNDECGVYDGDNPLPREDAVKVGECYNEIARRVVGPKAINAQLMNAYLIEGQEIRLKYKKGKIDRDEAKIEAQKSWNNYTAKLDNLYRNSMAQAYQADAQAAQQRQQAIQNMNAQAQQMNKTDTMKTTNCRVFGNNMTCTEF